MKLKERLYQKLIENPVSMAQAAREIGMSAHLLGKFLNQEKYPLQMKNKLLIEKWLQKKESELNNEMDFI